jgi:threonyl-tRNA synthetase
MPREPITITLPDGSTRDGTSYETTPMSIALAISKGLADKTVIAKVCVLDGFRLRVRDRPEH